MEGRDERVEVLKKEVVEGGGKEGNMSDVHLLFSVRVTWRRPYLLWRQPSRL